VQPTQKQIERQAEIDWRDRDHDSEDEEKREMMTYDERLTLINKLDYQNYLNSG
jgi:hypothetical protein